MAAAQKARRGLIAHGFGASLMACAAKPDSNGRSWPEEQCAHLAEIASYIGETDPLMIGAAWLLEQEGCERSQLTLFSGRRES